MNPTLLTASILAAFAATPAVAAASCAGLSRLALPATNVTRAEAVAAGLFGKIEVAAHCRVAFTVRPTADSEIKAEIWLPPESAWNGKLLGAGGGGFVGVISYAAMAQALKEGYAAASTDTGHDTPGARFALGHPEKVVDFAYRAVHEMTVQSKSIVAAHYGRPARLSYFQGCSTGGRQGLMEAERYPEDYDGIVAGAPANNQIALCGWRMQLLATVLKDPARALPETKTALLNQAVLNACDTLDGVADGLLEDPRKCRFDPAALLCRGQDESGCLTAPQVETVKMAYADARKSTGELIYPGLVRGGERGWLLPGPNTEPGLIDLDMFRFVAHQNPDWAWRAFDLERDVALAESKAGFMHAVSPDLSKFRARGGRLLIYHGWSDGGSGGAISPLNTIQYYENILKRMGANQADWLRLFMVPGMAHCGGGSGPNQFHALAALERWREQDQPPESIVAARVAGGRVDMTRPLCPYPRVAVYNGSGSIFDAVNFSCKAP